MPIPDFQKMFRPTLEFLNDGAIRHVKDIFEHLDGVFGLTEEERRDMVPSGQKSRFENRATWTLTHLFKAGLLEKPARGQYKITEVGKKALEVKNEEIDMRFLRRYPEYAEWRTAGPSEAPKTHLEDTESTPDEQMADGYKLYRAALADEALSKVKSCSPRFFEQLVVDLLVRMGYGGSVEEAARVVGKTGDGGIDGIIKEDKLGLDIIYVQAKRWENVVGASSVRDFSGSLDYHGAKKGVFITTSQFTRDARDFVTRIGDKKIVLVDGFELAQLMIDHDIGVSTVTTYTIKRLDSDYFEE
jgi:restriction system protein